MAGLDIRPLVLTLHAANVAHTFYATILKLYSFIRQPLPLRQKDDKGFNGNLYMTLQGPLRIRSGSDVWYWRTTAFPNASGPSNEVP
jgi:hypothetical protein